MFNQYEIENAAWKVDGYFSLSPAKPGGPTAEFERAKAEYLGHLRQALACAEGLTVEQFALATKRTKMLLVPQFETVDPFAEARSKRDAAVKLAHRRADAYYLAYDRAFVYAGPGDDQWATRYIKGLDLYGLCLSEVMPQADDSLYPTGLPFIAPRTPGFEDERDWSKSAVVVWKAPAADSIAR